MVVDGPVPLESETMTDSPVIAIPFFIVGKAGGKMSRHQANASIGIVHPDRYSTLVTCHTRQAGLVTVSFCLPKFFEKRPGPPS